MFAVHVNFRDENGKEAWGELLNSFSITVEGLNEVINVNQTNPVEVDVVTMDYTTDTMIVHRVPTLAIIEMKEVALA